MTKLNILDKKYNFLRPIKTDNLVRLGANADGGYVVDSNTIENCNFLISFGLGSHWSFELDCLTKNKNLLIFVYDHSVSQWPYLLGIWKYLRRFLTFRTPMEAVQTRIEGYSKFRKFINSDNVKLYNERIIYPPRESKDIDLKKVFSRINNKSEVILKSDIEGDEYKIIDQLTEYSSRIKMLMIEFHWIDKNEKIFLDSVKKLKKFFEIIHIHGNNHDSKLKNGLPITLEFTFLNKNLILNQKVEYIDDFPIKDLDYPNNPNQEDLNFSFRD